MPEVDIHIGGRVFQVSCQVGEEHFLESAAALLDAEAAVLAEALGRVPETRMLLMAGLMLADKTAGLEEELRAVNQSLEEQKELVRIASQSGAAQEAPEPERIEVEVPIIAPQVTETLSRIASRAEAVASDVEGAIHG